MTATDAETLTELFASVGLTPAKAAETAANKKLAPSLQTVIETAGTVTSSPVDKATGALLYTLASTAATKVSPGHLLLLAREIALGNLKSSEQISAGIQYAETVEKKGTEWIKSDFDKASGVGINVTREEIAAQVAAAIESKKGDLETKRYTILGALLGSVKGQLKWANALWVKEELDAQLLKLLGPKDDRDDPKKIKAASKKKAEGAASKPGSPSDRSATTPNAPAGPSSNRSIAELAKSNKFIFEGALSQLHKAGENPQIHPRLMEEHLKRTGGKVITRFPPEPNGFLHIGHAKAININFGYAQAFNGVTNLRYDDTNPEAEEAMYFTAIRETLSWLGYEPTEVKYSSDYFQKLFDLAIELIKKDKAYICHCTGEEIFKHRGGEAKGPRSECIHRSRPVSESLKEFLRMKNGEYKEGEAILRMKMDMQNPSPQFWDLVAYRVLYTPHFRTADQWCIYPTYDYTHCLCDSFEDITHSLCTTEFYMSRESYYWLVDALEIYKPVQWEYGRLNLTHTILSKRKLAKLVDEKIVNGWDDPRLYTLSGVRRRGFTPEAINAFVREIGVTTANTVIPVERLETFVREHLNQVAPRFMLLLDPVKVQITNLPTGHCEMVNVPNKPKDDAMGSRDLPFTSTLYIDASDFRSQDDDPNFYRLCIGKSVGLLHVPFPITATSVETDPKTGEMVIKAKYENDPSKPVKPKTYIQWVGDSKAHSSPVQLDAHLYSHLFKHSNPLSKEDVPEGWLTDINPDSLVVKKAMADIGVKSLKVEDKFQAVRVGYFCVDKNSDPKTGKFVLNRTVTLKEDSKKDK